MSSSLWILAVLMLIHLPPSIQGLFPSPASSRRILAHESIRAETAYAPSMIDCSNNGTTPCTSDPRVAPQSSILPRSRTLTIVVVVIFVACIVMGFFSVYARRYCVTDGNVNTSYRSVERARNLQALVGSLPIVQYAGGKAAEEVQARKNMRECAVCLSEFEEGETLRLLPGCGHLFHKECIDMWLFSHTTCPLCRLSLLNKSKRTSSDSPPPRVPSLAIDHQPILPPTGAMSSA